MTIYHKFKARQTNRKEHIALHRREEIALGTFQGIKEKIKNKRLKIKQAEELYPIKINVVTKL